MNGRGAITGDRPGAAEDLLAAAEAARERQSHVRHELRSPLAVIYPLLSLLLDGGAGELSLQQREYLEVLDRNVGRLEALITGVATSGWADCSAAPCTPAEVILGDCAEDLIALRAAEGARGAVVMVEAGAPSRRAFADREDVRQIVAGLVRNAVAFTPESGSVTIRTRSGDDGSMVVLEVTDTGPGVPPEELGRVFEFGFRGELARTLKVPGLGAGLWVGRELARRNGGDLRLASETGAGVTATLTLPSAAGAPA
jgi:two-component system sensor histidine kinase BaeS